MVVILLSLLAWRCFWTESPACRYNALCRGPALPLALGCLWKSHFVKMHVLSGVEAMDCCQEWLGSGELSGFVSCAVISLTVYLIQPAWCCAEHSHTAWEVSPGQLSLELTPSVPVLKVSKPFPNFPEHHKRQGSLLAVGRAA